MPDYAERRHEHPHLARRIRALEGELRTTNEKVRQLMTDTTALTAASAKLVADVAVTKVDVARALAILAGIQAGDPAVQTAIDAATAALTGADADVVATNADLEAAAPAPVTDPAPPTDDGA